MSNGSKTLLPLTLPALFLAAGCSDLASGSARLCKPVVPQIFVTMDKTPHWASEFRLLLRYYEAAPPPNKPKAKRGSARFSTCSTMDYECIASRARYEIRTEAERDQSIEIREMSGDGNPVIGTVRWNGPSYPDRVRIKCQLEEPRGKKSCTLQALEYTADAHNSGDYGGRPTNVIKHDKCTPFS